MPYIVDGLIQQTIIELSVNETDMLVSLLQI